MGVENQTPKENIASSPLDLLRERFPDAVLETSQPLGDLTALLRSEMLFKVMEFLKNDPRLEFNVLVDITAMDHLGQAPRFDVVYHLLSLPRKHRIRIKVRLEEGEPAVSTVSPLWGSANWLEREVWDMFGIRFTGHPDLRRILLYEEFQGHPLRKDYPIRKRQPRIGPKN